MICPHCRQKIADGSNICPLCFSSLAGYVQPEEPQQTMDAEPAAAPARRNSGAYTRGSRGRRRKNLAPTIVAIGIILLLLVVIAMIVRSMFDTTTKLAAATPTPVPRATLEAGSFIYFGSTATPGVRATATPVISVTPTPEPETPTADGGGEADYRTLRKGDQGVEVVTLQQALAELGYLTTASDGIYGTGTQTAVRAFQSDNGLDADGIAGKQTQKVLYELSSVKPVESSTPAPGDILDLPG